MSKYATLGELKEVAKAYCKKWVTHIFLLMNISLVLKIKMVVYGL